MPLEERAEALASFEVLLEELRAGQGRVLVLEGTAGIGKTRLLTAMLGHAEAAGLRTLRARAGELEQDFPFGVVHQLFEAELAGPARDELLSGAAELARPLFELASALPSADPQYQTLHGLYWLTVNAAEAGPLVLSVDDLQWCDAASLRFLDHLVRRIDGLGVLVLATMRPDAGREPDALDEITHSPATTVLRVPALSPAGVAALLAARFGGEVAPQFSAAVHESTAGNPLLLRELVTAAVVQRIEATAHGAEQLRGMAPESVGRLVLRRMAPLGPRSLALAEAVAVLGDGASLELAGELAGLQRNDASRSADALAGGDILLRAEHLTFAHPLVRRAVYDNMGRDRREELHAGAADLLAAAGAPTTRVAAHLLGVAPRGDERSVTILRDAAREAMARGAPDAAATYLSRALSEPPPEADRTAVTLDLGLAEAHGRPAAAAPRLLAVVDDAEDDEHLVQATIALAKALHPLDRDDEWAALALSVLDRVEDPQARRRLEAEFAFIGGFRPADYPAARKILGDLVIAPGTTDPVELMVLGLQASHATRELHAAEAAALARAALAGDGLIHTNVLAFGLPCTVLLHLERFDEAQTSLDAAYAHAQRTGFKAMLSMVSACRAWIELARGDIDAAESVISSDDGDGGKPTRVSGLSLTSNVLGDIALSRGDLVAAARHLDYRDDAEEPGVWGWAIGRARRGILRAAQGRLDEALTDLQTGGGWLCDIGAVNPVYLPWRSEAALVLSRLDRRDEALNIAQEEVDLATRWGAPRTRAHALVGLGLVTGGDEGIEVLREAAAVAADSDGRLVHATAATELGGALRRSNRRAEARKQLEQGLELAERCGATALVERAREELIATGARPRRAARTGVDSLTATELRVARMAAEGMTNREVAQALFVTPKTVEIHLSHTYAKLGLRSRAQLPDALRS